MSNFVINYFMRNQIIFACLALLISCTSSKKINTSSQPDSISQLKFLGEFDVPNGKQFKETTVGGLSGIDYDANNNIYYMISDDRSAINPARFYTAKVHLKENQIDSVEFIDVKTLLQKDGNPYPNSTQDPFHTPDPEDIRYNPIKDEVVWSSEGERNLGKNILEDPSVTVVD